MVRLNNNLKRFFESILESRMLYRFHKCFRVQKMSLRLMSSLLINVYERIYSSSNQTTHSIACALHTSFMVQNMILQFIFSSSLLINVYERIYSSCNQTAHSIACILHTSFMVQKMVLPFISSYSLLINMYERILPLTQSCID